MNLALADRQVDMVARLERAEDFGQAANLKQVRAVIRSALTVPPTLFSRCVLVPAGIVGAAAP